MIIELTLYNLGFYNRILTLFRKNHIQKEIKQSIKGRHRYPTVIRRRLQSAFLLPFVLRRCSRHARLPRPRPRFFYAAIVAVGAPNHRRVNHHRHQQQRISIQKKQFFWSAIEYCVRETETLRNSFLARIFFSGGRCLGFLFVVPTSYLFRFCRQVLIFFLLFLLFFGFLRSSSFGGEGLNLVQGFRYNCFFSWTSCWMRFDCSWLLFFVWVLVGFLLLFFWYWLSLLFRSLLRFCFCFFLCSLGLSFSSLSCLIYVVRSENLSNPIVNRSSLNFVRFEFNRKYEELLSTYEDFFWLKNSCAWQNPNISTSSLLYLV